MKMDDPGPDLEIAGDQITLHPTGFTKGPTKQDGSAERNLIEHMQKFRANPFQFLREISLFVSGTGWRAYEKVVGQPVFYSGYTDNMKAAVLRSNILQGKIDELTTKRLEVEESEWLLNKDSKTFGKDRGERKEHIRANLHEFVEKMIDQMICKMESNTFIRGAYYLATQLLTRAYHQGGAFPWVRDHHHQYLTFSRYPREQR